MRFDDADDEVTEYLLPLDEKEARKPGLRTPTPLPKLQVGVLLFFQLAEPITSQCIYPFINQLVSELAITGGDERRVGYYAGLIESLFFAAEAVFVLHWSRVSDVIGRKPVLLIGMAGLVVSMIFFGLSRTFLSLVLSRCLVGALNGNLGVTKSMMTELTDSTNRAQGFALLPVVWSTGATVGPFIGDPFWTRYPYFLPCAAAASISALTFCITAVFLKETVQTRLASAKCMEDAPAACPRPGRPIPMSALLTWPIMLSVACYALLAMLDISYKALQPLFFSTPIQFGGLGQSPAHIGATLAAFGLCNGMFQALFFAKLIDRFGPRRLYLTGVCVYFGLYGLFPVVNYLARDGGIGFCVVVLVASQFAMSVASDMAFGCIFLYVSAAAPNRHCLGATNGMAQLAASVVRAIGPALSTSLFAASVQHDWLGGSAVYVALIQIACLTLLVGRMLPLKVWNES